MVRDIVTICAKIEHKKGEGAGIHEGAAIDEGDPPLSIAVASLIAAAGTPELWRPEVGTVG